MKLENKVKFAEPLFTGDSFEQEIVKGFSSIPKRIGSRFLYDEEGDAIFREIMEMPQYYLTRCETEILSMYKEEILRLCCDDEPFVLIDLGAGDCTKSEILIEYFLKKNLPFEYVAIDISSNILDIALARLQNKFPGLQVRGINAEYMEALHMLTDEPERKLLLFLGSNLGNFDCRDAHSFLAKINDNLNFGDLLLLGLDLKKDPETIHHAYADDGGITERFNHNLLLRINRELGADFDPKKFSHHVLYEPVTGEVKTYLISKEKQSVYLKNSDKVFVLDKWESIQTECSNKYDATSITKMATGSGFKMLKSFIDSKGYFADCLWQK